LLLDEETDGINQEHYAVEFDVDVCFQLSANAAPTSKMGAQRGRLGTGAEQLGK
jgi:hypothetical protein